MGCAPSKPKKRGGKGGKKMGKKGGKKGKKGGKKGKKGGKGGSAKGGSAKGSSAKGGNSAGRGASAKSAKSQKSSSGLESAKPPGGSSSQKGAPSAPGTSSAGGSAPGGDFRERIAKAGPNQLIMIRFYKVDCQKCAMVGQFYQSLVVKYPQVIFLDANMARNLHAIGYMAVNAVPTFIAFKNHTEVGRYVGIENGPMEALVRNNA